MFSAMNFVNICTKWHPLHHHESRATQETSWQENYNTFYLETPWKISWTLTQDEMVYLRKMNAIQNDGASHFDCLFTSWYKSKCWIKFKKWYRWLYKQTLVSQSNFLDLNYSTSLLQNQKTWSEFIAPYHLEGLHSLFFME